MNDKGTGVIEQYDISIIKTLRGRGAFILETDKGYKRLMEYKGTYNRLEYLNGLLEYVYNSGFKNIDLINKNKEGMLFSNDVGGDKYLITDWFNGNECDVKSYNNILEGAATLAKLHNVTMGGLKIESIDELENIPLTENLIKEYGKHNQELKRVRTYIRGRKHKSEFEYDVLRHLEQYYQYGMDAMERIKDSSYEKLENESMEKIHICHGNYNYHNIIFDKNKIAVINFEKSGKGILIKDLYLFLRKVMEKHDWNIATGHEILKRYNEIRSISEDEYELLKIMLMYPEKFWKVVNHYFNSNKSWIPDKNIEKLNQVYYQQGKKEEFVLSM